MAVRVTDDGMGRIWVTSTLDDRGPAVRFTLEEWAQFLEQVRAGVDCPQP
jgi:hypothetical protein